MKIIALFMHVYLLLQIYELFTAEKNCLIKGLAILLMGIVKQMVECSPYTKPLEPIILCTLLILYSISIHSKNSNVTNFKFSLISYGINYAINLVFGSICGLIVGLIEIWRDDWGFAFLSICRILVIIILYKKKIKLSNIKQVWVYQIGMIAAIVLMFTDQIIRIAHTMDNEGYTNIGIACTYLAVLFTILWLLDHYKMAKIQKEYADDNRQMSQKLHRSKEVLPMIANYVSSMDGTPDERMRKKLEEVCHDYGKELGGAEMSAELFDTTGIDLVDLLLRTKIIECSEQDIELNVFVNAQIDEDMKRLDIGDGEIMRLLGDLLRNAINAVSGLRDQMILLLIARDGNGCVVIRIYDSGIPFPPYILERFGERGNTTWGTGNGLADLMETLNRVEASIEINTDLDPTDVFTKEIYICFDGKADVKVGKKDAN